VVHHTPGDHVLQARPEERLTLARLDELVAVRRADPDEVHGVAGADAIGRRHVRRRQRDEVVAPVERLDLHTRVRARITLGSSECVVARATAARRERHGREQDTEHQTAEKGRLAHVCRLYGEAFLASSVASVAVSRANARPLCSGARPGAFVGSGEERRR
jgi:hypothetical protein